MKKILFTLLITPLCSFSFSKTMEKPTQILHGHQVSQVKFIYKSFDGQVIQNCQHKTSAGGFPGELDVSCKTENFTKDFTVKLALRRYDRNRMPPLSYELNFWVTERRQGLPSNGTTVWFHMKSRSQFHSVSASQSVDDDTAGLYVELAP